MKPEDTKACKAMAKKIYDGNEETTFPPDLHHQLYLIAAKDQVTPVPEACTRANIEQYLRTNGATPKNIYSSMDQTNDAMEEAPKDVIDLCIQRTENAKKSQGSKDVYAEAFGHHKASTSTSKHVVDRMKNLFGELKKNGETSIYEAPTSIHNLVQTYIDFQKKLAKVCY